MTNNREDFVKMNRMSIFTHNTCKMDESLNDWVMTCILFVHQYIATWIDVMPYWNKHISNSTLFEII